MTIANRHWPHPQWVLTKVICDAIESFRELHAVCMNAGVGTKGQVSELRYAQIAGRPSCTGSRHTGECPSPVCW
eukprot:5454628-Prymnesium_polylepis.1